MVNVVKVQVIENDPSCLVPQPHCDGCGLLLPPVRRNRRYHDNKCKQQAYRKRRMKEMEECLRDACYILNSYADIVTWDEDLSSARDALYARIKANLGEPYWSSEGEVSR